MGSKPANAGGAKRLTMDTLAELVGCEPDELPGLIAKLPRDGVTDRWRYVLHLRYEQGFTLRQVGAELGVTGSYVSVLERTCIERLQRAQAGLLGLSVRLRRIFRLEAREDLTAIIPHVYCHGLRRRRNVGLKVLQELHTLAEDLGVEMMCGCPTFACEFWQKITAEQGSVEWRREMMRVQAFSRWRWAVDDVVRRRMGDLGPWIPEFLMERGFACGDTPEEFVAGCVVDLAANQAGRPSRPGHSWSSWEELDELLDRVLARRAMH